jgi:hypothetical protein
MPNLSSAFWEENGGRPSCAGEAGVQSLILVRSLLTSR